MFRGITGEGEQETGADLKGSIPGTCPFLFLQRQMARTLIFAETWPLTVCGCPGATVFLLKKCLCPLLKIPRSAPGGLSPSSQKASPAAVRKSALLEPPSTNEITFCTGVYHGELPNCAPVSSLCYLKDLVMPLTVL